MVWLIVGLGNPGSRYLMTRHNVGFIWIDSFLRSHSALQVPRSEHQAETHRMKWRFSDGEQTLIFAKPQTYMNKSGESVRALMDFYKVPLHQVLVVHDDIDQEFGGVRFHQNRGAGGHNGIKSISQILGTQDYSRLKLGVGRPPIPQMPVADYVLQNFNSDEMNELPDFLDFASDAVECFLDSGLQKASSLFNRSYKSKENSP